MVTVDVVDNNTLRLTGKKEGSAQSQIAVGDGRGGSAIGNFAVQVNPAVVPNQFPVISDIPDHTLILGQSIKVSFTMSDPDNDPLAVTTFSENPALATIFQSANTEVTITGNGVVQIRLAVTVSDGRGGEVTDFFNVKIDPAPNNPPVIQAITSGKNPVLSTHRA